VVVVVLVVWVKVGVVQVAVVMEVGSRADRMVAACVAGS
jgi:hypothetical protein